MKIKETVKNEYQQLKVDSDKGFNLSILFACLILFIYCYFGSFSFFEKTFTNIQNLDYWKIIYHNCMSFILFFCIGIIFTKVILKQKLKDIGFGVGNKKMGLYICLIALPIAILCGLTTVLDNGMTSTYPLIDFNVYGKWYQILVYFASYLLYYIGWEFLFRGILLVSSEKKCGAMGAILLTTLISALIHTSIGAFGKPMIETLSAIPAGIIFGYIAHKTKSIYPTLFIHFIIGVSTDLFIFLIC